MDAAVKLALLLLLAIAAHSAEPVLRGQCISGLGMDVQRVPLGCLFNIDAPAMVKLIREEIAAAFKAAPVPTTAPAVPAPITSPVLDFPAIPDGDCRELTFAAPGVTAVAPRWGDLEPGLFGLMRVSTAGTVAVRLCNLSGVLIDPAARAYNATVVR